MTLLRFIPLGCAGEVRCGLEPERGRERGSASDGPNPLWAGAALKFFGVLIMLVQVITLGLSSAPGGFDTSELREFVQDKAV
ncbi:hypothetical protein NKDENANG_01042 [Candidatus Entotheonellaceae bacterium PAL068K]